MWPRHLYQDQDQDLRFQDKDQHQDIRPQDQPRPSPRHQMKIIIYTTGKQVLKKWYGRLFHQSSKQEKGAKQSDCL